MDVFGNLYGSSMGETRWGSGKKFFFGGGAEARVMPGGDPPPMIRSKGH